MRKITFVCVVAAILCGMICSCTNGVSEKETKKSLMIEVPVPERPAGQKDVVNLVTPKLDTVRVGFIGLGMRGPGAVERFLHIPGTKVVALCDIRPEQVEKCQGILKKAGIPEAAGYSGSEDAWKQLCEREDINLVYIATDWLHHAPMALYAMEHGKHVAIEVPAAMNMEEIWALINMAEKKQLHCMMLENCVYDFFELTTWKGLIFIIWRNSGLIIGITGVWIITGNTGEMFMLLTVWDRLVSCWIFTGGTK